MPRELKPHEKDRKRQEGARESSLEIRYHDKMPKQLNKSCTSSSGACHGGVVDVDASPSAAEYAVCSACQSARVDMHFALLDLVINTVARRIQVSVSVPFFDKGLGIFERYEVESDTGARAIPCASLSLTGSKRLCSSGHGRN